MKEITYNDSMMQAITWGVAEATNTAILAVKEAKSTGKHVRTQPLPRMSGIALKQPTFDWKAQDKYNELHSFGIEVINIFQMNSSNIHESKQVPVLIN